MYRSNDDFKLGNLDISPILGCIKLGSNVTKVEPLIMDALTLLASRNGETVFREEFLARIWSARDVSDESLTRAISILRKTFKKLDPEVDYIETIPKRGYRLLVKVEDNLLQKTSPESGAKNQSATNGNADEMVLQARSLNERPFHADVLTISVSLLEQAIALNPKHAGAHSELGHAYSLMSTYLRDGDKTDFIRRATVCAEKALAIDPNMGFPLTLIALEQFTLRNIVGAIEMTQEAYKREPGNSEIALRLGYFYAAIGLTARALPYIEQAVSINPIQGRNFQILATVKLCNGDLDEADALAKRAIDMQHHFACETYAAIAFAKGEYKLAGQRLLNGRSYLAMFLGDKFVDPTVWEKILNDAYSPNQQTREALGVWIKTFLHVPGQPPSIPLAQAVVRTGPATTFFEIMGNAPPPGTHGTLLCIWGKTQNCLAIRNSPEFLPFTERMGMTPAWEKYGYPDCMA